MSINTGGTIKLCLCLTISRPSSYYHVTGFTILPKNLTLLSTRGLRMLVYILCGFDRASITNQDADLSMERYDALFQFLKKNTSDLEII